MLKKNMNTADKILAILLTDEVSDATFKALSWLSASALSLYFSLFSFKNNDILAGLFLIVLFLFLFLQTFKYSIIHISIPICETLFPDTDYKKTFKLLFELETEFRMKLVYNLLHEKQTWAILILYVLFFFALNTILDSFLLKALGITMQSTPTT